MKKKNTISRRQFLSYSAMAGAIGAMGAAPLMVSCSESDNKKSALKPLKKPGEYYIPELMDKAVDGKELKAGLIGCGGRGSGAIMNFLNAADNVTVTALGDVFPDKVRNVKGYLKKEKNITVADDNCFTGFDAYKKVIDSGVDVVLVCTPPAFRPEHFRYATEKGVHSFLEKPVAVDAAGFRMMMATAKQAQAKGLSVITGTQRHHQPSYVESYKKIQEGYIGEITGGNVYWNQSMLWYRNKDKNWTDTEWMIRDWVNWTWLSGDHIVEQHVHNIDVFTWMSGLKPVKATGFGSRQRRVTGDQYDNFSIDFEFENGIHVHSMCRQINGCSDNISEHIQGTLGSWHSTGAGENGWSPCIKDLQGNIIWEYDKETVYPELTQTDPYTLEHVNWINHIRKGQEPIMQAEETAISTMAGVMGRESAYTGKTVTWDELTSKGESMMPEKLELANVDMSKFKVPVPGN